MMGCCGVEEKMVGRRDEAVRAKGERDWWRCMAGFAVEGALGTGWDYVEVVGIEVAGRGWRCCERRESSSAL